MGETLRRPRVYADVFVLCFGRTGVLADRVFFDESFESTLTAFPDAAVDVLGELEIDSPIGDVKLGDTIDDLSTLCIASEDACALAVPETGPVSVLAG